MLDEQDAGVDPEVDPESDGEGEVVHLISKEKYRSEYEVEYPAFAQELLDSRSDPALLHAYAYATMFVRIGNSRHSNENLGCREFFTRSFTHSTLLYSLMSTLTEAIILRRSSYVGILQEDLEAIMKKVESKSRAAVQMIIREATDAGWVRKINPPSGVFRQDVHAYTLSPEVFYLWLKITGRDIQSIQNAVGTTTAIERYESHLEAIGQTEPPLFKRLKKAYERDCGMELNYSKVT